MCVIRYHHPTASCTTTAITWHTVHWRPTVIWTGPEWIDMFNMSTFAYTLIWRFRNSRHLGDLRLPVSLKKITELSGIGEFLCPVYTDRESAHCHALSHHLYLNEWSGSFRLTTTTTRLLVGWSSTSMICKFVITWEISQPGEPNDTGLLHVWRPREIIQCIISPIYKHSSSTFPASV